MQLASDACRDGAKPFGIKLDIPDAHIACHPIASRGNTAKAAAEMQKLVAR
jgi:hypothetical protein